MSENFVFTKAQGFENRHFVFNPLDQNHKSPCGAIKRGGALSINFRLIRSLAASEVFFVLKKDGEDEVWYKLKWKTLELDFDVYKKELSIQTSGLYFYYFYFVNEHGGFYIGADENLNASYGGSAWQLSVFEEYYKPSGLLKGNIAYHIFVDRFNISGKRKKSFAINEYREDWGGVPRHGANSRGEYAVDFFGGNLKGITQKLEYLASLNVGVIYLSPIFRARSNHKYDVGDYMNVDDDFGTNEDFVELCKKGEALGIKVLLDGVFSHTGDDSLYFNKYGRYKSLGAYQSTSSPYHSWYRFTHFPNSYESWWGISTLPNVNENNPSFNAYINGKEGVVRTWLKRGAAGFRLDVADELPDEFLDNLTRAAKTQKSDAFILGEVWEDASNKVSYGYRRRYFEGRQLDSVMNYPVKNAILSFAKGWGSGELVRVFINQINNYPKNVLDNMFNILGSHDTVRVLSELGSIDRVKNAAVLQYFCYGAPCVFYGDEAAVTGGKDPFCRVCYPWGKENGDLVDFYKKLGGIRKKYKKTLSDAPLIIESYDFNSITFTRGEIRVYVNALENKREITLNGERLL